MRLKFDYKATGYVGDITIPLIVIPANSFITYKVKIQAVNPFTMTLHFYSENYLKVNETSKGPATDFTIDDATYGFAHFIIVMVDREQNYEVSIQTETIYPV
jgi:hypothetical protein